MDIDKDVFQRLFEIMAKNGIKDKGIKEKQQPNIFRILGIEAKEVLICRFLAFLLNLSKAPGKKERPLQSFLNDVLDVRSYGLEEDASVSLEEVITKKRRVDMVIRNGAHIYPIEVKIWADDQDAQLEDYYNHYFSERDVSDKKIYYLTPTGWEPSKKSKGSLGIGEQIKIVSFSERVLHWLKNLVKNELVPNDLRSIVLQFIEVINDMTKASVTENAIIDAVGLKDGFQVTDELRTLITILNANEDTNGRLQRIIQTSFLKSKLRLGDGFTYVDHPDKDEIKGTDSHALIYIGTNESNPRIIAWVCVHENLYIGWKKRGNKPEENWQYILPKKYVGTETKCVKMDNCEIVLEENIGDIDVSEILNKLL